MSIMKHLGKYKLIYLLKARLPTEKAHGYQSMKTSEAFLNGGVDLEVWIPRRINSIELQVPVEEYYQLETKIPIKKMFGLDFLYLVNKLPQYLRFKQLVHVSALANSLMYYASVVFKIIISCEKNTYYTRDPNLVSFISIFLPQVVRENVFLELHTLSSTHRRKTRQIKILKKCAGVITVTSAMRTRLIEQGMKPSSIIVEPDAVDLKFFDVPFDKFGARNELNLQQDIKIAAFVGKYHTNGEEKGIPEILVAASRLAKSYPDLHFYFIGGPLERVSKYQQIMKQLELSDERVKFIEKQPISEVPLWLKSADILLMPHPYSEFYAFYVSPLKMFEYMSSGRPIVASDLPAITEVLEHNVNALLGKPGDSTDIANNISMLLDDEDLRNMLSSEAKRTVLNYTWSSRVKRLISFIREKSQSQS